MDKTDTAIRKGKQAEILLDDPLLKEALDVLENSAIQSLLNCQASDLVECRANANAIEKLRVTLRSYLDSAKIAARTIET